MQYRPHPQQSESLFWVFGGQMQFLRIPKEASVRQSPLPAKDSLIYRKHVIKHVSPPDGV
jgi:hypothetical protein